LKNALSAVLAAALVAAGAAAGAAPSACQPEQVQTVQAEKARVQAHLRQVQAFRAGLGGSPNEQLAAQKAELAIGKDQDAIEKIEQRIRLHADIAGIAQQIEQTKRQLATLGFNDRSADFERIGEMSRAEQALTKTRLLKQLRKVTLDKGAKYMQDRFLTRIQSMSPQKVRSLAGKLKKAGADDPLFQEWLLSFTRNAPREVLANGARETIKFIEKEEHLEKMLEALEPETVEGNQDAFLELVSLVSDFPAIGELSAVAAGAYQLGEAGVFLFVLSGNQDHLDSVTQDQLSKQKILMKRMESLIGERKRICAALAR
jgi:hypothetical protein